MILLRKERRGSDINIDFKIRGTMAGIKYPCLAQCKYDGNSVTIIHEMNNMKMTTEKHTRYIQSQGKDSVAVNGIYLAEWVIGHGEWNTLYRCVDSRMEECQLIYFDCLAVYDCGTLVDMTSKPLVSRMEVLAHQKLRLPAQRICNTEEEVERFYKTYVDNGFEGLVIKNLNETFISQRWVKMKPKERLTHGTATGSN